MDKKKIIMLGVGAGAIGLWYLHQKSNAAAATGTTAATDTSGTDSGSLDTGSWGGGADTTGGGYGDGLPSGGYGAGQGNFSGLPPVTITSTPVATSKRTVTVGKGETQRELIEAAGIPYSEFLALNPQYGSNGKSNGKKVTSGSKVIL